jgi:hypothetical protein
MLIKAITIINPIVYLVFITFSIGLIFLDKSKLVNKFLFIILTNYFITELFSIFLNYNSIPVAFLYNISIILQFVFWLLILSKVLKKQSLLLVYLFLVFATISLFFKLTLFNTYNLIIGSILYLTLYIFENFKLLNQEKIDFFQSNDYFLISIPLLFFLGMAFLFSFDLKSLTKTIIFGKTNLYTVINYFVNIIYYSLINIYIYKEKKASI